MPGPADTATEPIDDVRIREILSRWWGFETLRPLPADAIRAALGGRDSLVVMPTGGGKSLCYQLPPLVNETTDVVVSPLVALMKDQVDALEAIGYPAAALHSGLSPDERRQIRELLAELQGVYRSRGIRLDEVAGGFTFRTNPLYGSFVREVTGQRPVKLTRAQIESLAIVAYRQPVTRSEMEALRGVSVDSALNRLLELELLAVTGRAELPGRPIQYGTTDKFLDFTGLRSLGELPASDVLSPAQISEWITRATTPVNIGDSEVGLPLDDQSAAVVATENPPEPEVPTA